MTVNDRLNDQRRHTVSDSRREEALTNFRDPHRTSKQATGHNQHHDDHENIRRTHSVPPWSPEPYNQAEYSAVLPDCLKHEWSAPPERTSGGTDWLARGKPGSGKSTLGNHLATRLMEINDEIVFWRGSESRSEWLPLAPWSTLWLPADVDISPRLVPRDKTNRSVPLRESDLSEIVREVRYYANPLDVLDANTPGSFHVVYPDPLMRGCQELLNAAESLEYDTPKRGTLFGLEDPANHWWFGFVLARVAHLDTAPFTTLILDEIGDIAPQSASKDQFGTYQKVELLKDLWVDARRFGLTLGLFCHSEIDIHQAIRHKIRWRIQMPKTSNPTSAGSTVGFSEIPMDHDLAAHMKLGEGLMYSETNFDRFRWPDYDAGTSYKLKVAIRGDRQ